MALEWLLFLTLSCSPAIFRSPCDKFLTVFEVLESPGRKHRFFEETITNKYGEPKILKKKEFLDRGEKTYLAFELNRSGIPL